MPSVKEKCICQICICGKHHCGQEIKFPSLIEEPEKEKSEEAANKVVTPDVAAAAECQPHLPELDSKRIECHTQSTHIKHIQVNNDNCNDQETDQMSDTKPGFSGAELDGESLSVKTLQRKTWQTSPEQVEELTRSLSRMRTDHENGGYLYEKMVEKEKSKTLNRTDKDKVTNNNSNKKGTKQTESSSHYDQPHLVNGAQHPHISTMAHKTANNKNGNNGKESFFPPLSGFSDSDSSFGSCSCSFDGDQQHDRHLHCICESVRQTKLKEHEEEMQLSECGNSFIDSDKWIVTRPTRMKPRDNLRLEGPMEMETTFRSTYDCTAQHMIDRANSEDNIKSKRSTATTTSRTNKYSPNLYLNTRKGRTGAAPILRSAKNRRPNRNRPMTSLKTGGDGYYNTNNREAYKNFVIVNGEAKMVTGEQQQIKFPRVVTTKTTTLTSKEKNRHKQINNKFSKDATIGFSSSRPEKNDQEKMVLGLGGEEIRKFERKSFVTKSDGTEQELERKFIHKVQKCPVEMAINEQSVLSDANPVNVQTDTVQEDLAKQNDANKQEVNWTVENINGTSKRSFVSRNKDNIKELGLLDLNNEPSSFGLSNKPTIDVYRQHMRRLHETSKDFCVNNLNADQPTASPSSLSPTVVRQKNVKVTIEPDKAAKSPTTVVNGHAVMAASRKPFIIPQRIHKHKNECSTNVFEGEIDFTTTNRHVYGTEPINDGKSRARVTSASRKRTAGRRYLKSGKRRNLFRQSSDSMFSSGPSDIVAANQTLADQKAKNKVNNTEMTIHESKSGSGVVGLTSTYKKEFDDRLYCPALDVAHSPQEPYSNENFKYTGEASGHKYYLPANYG